MYIAARGVQVKWCNGLMFEQSPFSVQDFAKQRQRWYAGLWLCVRSPRLVLWRRVFLGMHVFSWALCPLLNVLNWFNILVNFERSLWLRAIVSLLYAAPCWGYLLGFFLTFKPSMLAHGHAEWVLLLWCQIVGIPIFAAMEAYGILLAVSSPCLAALTRFTRWARGETARPVAASAFGAFAIVKKEGTDAKRRAAEMGSLDGASRAQDSELRQVEVHLDLDGCYIAGPEDAERYWRSRLRDAPPALQLPPADPLPDPADAAREMAQTYVHISAGQDADALGAAAFGSMAVDDQDDEGTSADHTGVSPVATAAAALAWVAAVHARTDEVIVHAQDGDVSALLRLRLNTLQATPGSALTLASLSRAAASQLKEAARVGNTLPLARLLACGPPSWQSEGGSAVALAVSNSTRPPLDDMTLSLRVPTNNTVQPDGEEMVHARLYYHPARLSAGAAARYAERIARVVGFHASSSLAGKQATQKKVNTTLPFQHVALQQVPLLGPDESALVTVECNCTSAPTPDATTVHAAFARVASSHPMAVALCSHRGSPLATYADLHQASERMAAALLGLRTLTPQRRLIGLIFERSVAMVVAIFGSLMAGGAYLPIDPAFPRSRMQAMAVEARIAALVVGAAQADGVRTSGVSFDCTVVIGTGEGLLRPLTKRVGTNLPPAQDLPLAGTDEPLHASFGDLVYVMYTVTTQRLEPRTSCAPRVHPLRCCLHDTTSSRVLFEPRVWKERNHWQPQGRRGFPWAAAKSHGVDGTRLFGGCRRRRGVQDAVYLWGLRMCVSWSPTLGLSEGVARVCALDCVLQLLSLTSSDRDVCLQGSSSIRSPTVPRSPSAPKRLSRHLWHSRAASLIIARRWSS